MRPSNKEKAYQTVNTVILGTFGVKKRLMGVYIEKSARRSTLIRRQTPYHTGKTMQQCKEKGCFLWFRPTKSNRGRCAKCNRKRQQPEVGVEVEEYLPWSGLSKREKRVRMAAARPQPAKPPQSRKR